MWILTAEDFLFDDPVEHTVVDNEQENLCSAANSGQQTLKKEPVCLRSGSLGWCLEPNEKWSNSCCVSLCLFANRLIYWGWLQWIIRDEREYYANISELQPISCTLTGKASFAKRIPDALIELAIIRSKQYRNAVASYEPYAERLKALALHWKPGLLSDPRCGKANLVFQLVSAQAVASYLISVKEPQP